MHFHKQQLTTAKQEIINTSHRKMLAALSYLRLEPVERLNLFNWFLPFSILKCRGCQGSQFPRLREQVLVKGVDLINMSVLAGLASCRHGEAGFPEWRKTRNQMTASFAEWCMIVSALTQLLDSRTSEVHEKVFGQRVQARCPLVTSAMACNSFISVLPVFMEACASMGFGCWLATWRSSAKA